MSSALPIRLLADAILILHFAFILFVVGTLVLVVVGNYRAWSWVNGFWLRVVHLAAIGFVIAESWFGLPCPLTALEAWLRTRAGATTYSQGFIQYWFQHGLSYEVPSWVLASTDTAVGLLTLLAWWAFPPRSRHRAPKREA